MVQIRKNYRLISTVKRSIISENIYFPEGALINDKFDIIFYKEDLTILKDLLKEYEDNNQIYKLYNSTDNLTILKIRNSILSSETPKCIECYNDIFSDDEIISISPSNFRKNQKHLNIHKNCLEDFQKTINDLLSFYNNKYIFNKICIKNINKDKENTFKVCNCAEHIDLEPFMDNIKNTYQTEPIENKTSNCGYCYDQYCKKLYKEKNTGKMICPNCLDKIAFRYLPKYKEYKKVNTIKRL